MLPSRAPTERAQMGKGRRPIWRAFATLRFRVDGQFVLMI